MRSEKSGASPAALCGDVDSRPPAQFWEQQGGIHGANAVEIAIDEAVQQIANIESARLAGGSRVPDYVDCAAVAQQLVKPRVSRELIDSSKIDPQELAHVLRGCPDAVQLDVLMAVIGAQTYKIALIAHDVD
jgi:hypothetical protein